MTSVRFNVFQRLIRQWDTVHPYNAAQIIRLAGQADSGAIQAAWEKAVVSLGLGPLHIRWGRFGYEAQSRAPGLYDVPLLPAGADLCDYVSNQLNRPFEVDHYLPLRPFALQQEGSYYAGLVYQHWIADSYSIRLLMRQWFMYLLDPAQARPQPMIFPRGGYRRYFGPDKSRCGWGGQILMMLQGARRLRCVRRLQDPNSGDFTMRLAIHRLPPSALAGALEFARSHHVTLNDLFLAAIAGVCDRSVPSRIVRRRQNLALGTIVDLRSRSRENLDDLFGLFLGYANVICQRDELRDFPTLLQSIARQSRANKATDQAQASACWMACAMLACAFHPPRKRIPFFRKHLPLLAGISNVNLNTTWCAAYHPHPLLEYLRISPTGPLVPLVFTPTTLGDQFHFAMTYRSAIFSDAQAGQMADSFTSSLWPAKLGVK
jgi:hypothetical protein